MLKNKTVRKRFISKILSLLTLFVVVSAPALFAAVASCSGNTGSSGTKFGTIDGVCYSYYCSDTTIKKISQTNASSCVDCSGGVKYELAEHVSINAVATEPGADVSKRVQSRSQILILVSLVQVHNVGTEQNVKINRVHYLMVHVIILGQHVTA